MDEDQELKHICKFCSKSFPCGRSLGGHMRSHLITLPSSSSDHNPKKKLPPLVNGGQLSYTLRENPRKTNKSLKSSDEDTLLQEKFCKECGKSFHSWKALFGHMKCHSVNGRNAANSTVEEDSWNSSNKQATASSQSDNEGSATLLLKKKRSKRYMKSMTNSSSLTIENYDQHEQEEVALSLIILSRDKGNWGGNDSAFDSSDYSSEFVEAKEKQDKPSLLKTPLISRNLQVSAYELNDQSEVNSPRKNKSRKRKLIDTHDFEEVIVPTKAEISQDFDKKSKFTCSICKKAFPSYQALGGHRASHKKFKGSCAPTGENCSIETAENSPNQISDNKEHECPICFRVFPSGQALGGHKRSHLIADQAKGRNPSAEITRKPEGQIRNFLDLNLPAPVEEECSDFKSWWLGASHKHEPLLGLLSS